MANPVGSFIWYELMTTDANAAAKFYGSVMGWKIPDRADPNAPSGRDYRMLVRDDGGAAGGMLQLTHEMQKGGARPTWLGYLYVKDVDAAVRAIQADGGKLQMPRMDLPVGQIAMVTDPMGTPFYVMNPIPPAGKPDATSDVYERHGKQRVNWNELGSPDAGHAKRFYAKHFGFEFNQVMNMGEMGDYSFIDHGGQQIGAIMPKQKDNPGPAAWHFYFNVPSAGAAKRAIEAGGGKALSEPMQVPGGEWVLSALDPQGAGFGVVSPKEN